MTAEQSQGITDILALYRAAGHSNMDDSFAKNPHAWTEGLECKQAAPNAKPWFAGVPDDLNMDIACALVDQANGEFPAYSIRHAWPRDLFELLLGHTLGAAKVTEFTEANAKIFVVGSAYWPPQGHPDLDDGPHILCVQTAKDRIALEPARDPETWRKELGRTDYILMMYTTRASA